MSETFNDRWLQVRQILVNEVHLNDQALDVCEKTFYMGGSAASTLIDQAIAESQTGSELEKGVAAVGNEIDAYMEKLKASNGMEDKDG